MGALHLECAVADNDGTSLYGLAYGSDYSLDKNSPDNYERVLVVQSSTKPDSVATMTWSLLSSFRRDSLVRLAGPSTICTVDDRGVFTAVSSSSSLSPSTGTGTVPGGIRYDPGTGGSGVWSNISFPSNNGWQNPTQSNILFNLKTTTGTNQLVHALVAAGTSGGIAFATLGATSPYQFASGPTWSLGSSLVDIATSHIAYSSGMLFYLSSTLISPKLTAIPIGNTISSSLPTGSTSASLNMASACGVTGPNVATASGSKVYYQCS
ncbi:hypothetical protein BGZ83_009427, partial [Gryganskiella cystojenkinii]